MRKPTRLAIGWTLALAGISVGCQSYDFVFQPNTDRQAVHLRFDVERPSKTDILFVVDNSVSMAEEQTALTDAFRSLIDALAPQDTRYRIGITSTDTIGDTQDCTGTPIDSVFSPGAKGNCSRPEVILRRPHDGAFGRLIAAYDPDAFDTVNDPYHIYTGRAVATEDLNAAELTAIQKLLPTSATTHPAEYAALFSGFSGYTPTEGVRWVIDRQFARLEACLACNCTTTDPDTGLPTCREDDTTGCFEGCSKRIAPKLVEAYFRSNIAGLGTSGAGYEEGLKAGLLAVGIDATDPNNDTAIEPAADLTLVGRPNSFTGLDDDGVPGAMSWMRDEAVLATMFVSDEQDCSMPPSLYFSIDNYEENPAPGERTFPHGGACYRQDVLGTQFLLTSRMATLITDKKGGVASRVATGFIGGVREVTTATGTSTTPSDCIQDASGNASTACSCLVGTSDDRWCCLTSQKELNSSVVCPYPEYITSTSTTTMLGQCEALGGSRYYNFVNSFRSPVFDSICKSDFSDAMRKFAERTVVACFELAEAALPVENDSKYITVNWTPRDAAALGAAPTVLPERDPSATEPGWFYDTIQHSICLTGMDRTIGDVYDIYIFNSDSVEFGN